MYVLTLFNVKPFIPIGFYSFPPFFKILTFDKNAPEWDTYLSEYIFHRKRCLFNVYTWKHPCIFISYKFQQHELFLFISIFNEKKEREKIFDIFPWNLLSLAIIQRSEIYICLWQRKKRYYYENYNNNFPVPRIKG